MSSYFLFFTVHLQKSKFEPVKASNKKDDTWDKTYLFQLNASLLFKFVKQKIILYL